MPTIPQVETFLDWLISMDDPESESGMNARREVTLTRIIERARAAKGPQPDVCPEVEGNTGIGCELDAGHALPHEGWHNGHGYAERTIAIAWPVPTRPARVLVS